MKKALFSTRRIKCVLYALRVKNSLRIPHAPRRENQYMHHGSKSDECLRSHIIVARAEDQVYIILPRCIIYYFLHRNVNQKSNISSVWRCLPQQQEEKTFSLATTSQSPAIERLDIPDLPFTFYSKKVLFLHLLKKVLCITRKQLTFSNSDNDYEHSCITCAQSSSSLEKVNFPLEVHKYCMKLVRYTENKKQKYELGSEAFEPQNSSSSRSAGITCGLELNRLG